MPRQYVLNGETLVEVRGGCHASGFPIGVLSELGLAEDQIRISPQINFKDINVNDFGPNVPADLLRMLSSVKISMTLVNYSPEVLDICIAESMGISRTIPDIGIPGVSTVRLSPDNGEVGANSGQFLISAVQGGTPLQPGDFAFWVGGTLAGAGTPMGGLKRIFESGWHYISLNLSSQILGQPWTFPKCYLSQYPVKIPIGNELSYVEMEWTAIPYWDAYQSGISGYGSIKVGNLPYPNQQPGATMSMTLRGDVPSEGSILWTRVRDVPDSLILPMG
jgi:hypothetical protein